MGSTLSILAPYKQLIQFANRNHRYQMSSVNTHLLILGCIQAKLQSQTPASIQGLISPIKEAQQLNHWPCWCLSLVIYQKENDTFTKSEPLYNNTASPAGLFSQTSYRITLILISTASPTSNRCFFSWGSSVQKRPPVSKSPVCWADTRVLVCGVIYSLQFVKVS